MEVFLIVDRDDEMLLVIEDEDLQIEVAKRMIKAGAEVVNH
ncbi:hypothetical protein [Streptomyces gardneri]